MTLVLTARALLLLCPQSIGCVLTRTAVEQISSRRVGPVGNKDSLTKAFNSFHPRFVFCVYVRFGMCVFVCVCVRVRVRVALYSRL